MTFPFPINRKFNYPALNAITADDGFRVYMTPGDIPAPSVTTILSTLPKPALDAWRERVGHEEADRITKEACEIGSTMHDTLEGYVSDYLQGRPEYVPVTDKEKMAHAMALVIRQFGLQGCLEEVWAIEEALHLDSLYAGRTDLIGVYEGKPSIIDYKTTRRPKPEEWITSYKLQLAAYAVAHEHMTDFAINRGVILMAVRPGQKKRFQRFIFEGDEFLHYKQEWLDLVEKFWA